MLPQNGRVKPITATSNKPWPEKLNRSSLPFRRKQRALMRRSFCKNFRGTKLLSVKLPKQLYCAPNRQLVYDRDHEQTAIHRRQDRGAYRRIFGSCFFRTFAKFLAKTL